MSSTPRRTDPHRPSVLRAADYEYVGVECARLDSAADVYHAAEDRARIRAHMARTGGTYSTHDHGGTCHVCGASAIYTVLWYHRPTGVYVRTGEDCADSISRAWDRSALSALRQRVADARDAAAGRRKAAALLADWGVSDVLRIAEEHPARRQAWEAEREAHRAAIAGGAIAPPPPPAAWRGRQLQDEATVLDLYRRLVRYGSLTDRQRQYLTTLLERIRTAPARAARWEAEREAAEPCPTGRVEIAGRILKYELRATDWGVRPVWTVRDDRGWIVWGTRPATLLDANGESYYEQPRAGDRVRYTATVEPSDRDPKFGFARRPTAAEIEPSAEES